MAGRQGLQVAMLGGDRRHREAARNLTAAGLTVRSCALTDPIGTGSIVCESAAQAVAGAKVIIAPVQGIDAGGTVYTEPGLPLVHLKETELSGLAPGAICYTGWADPAWRDTCTAAGVELVEYRDWNEFALLNAVPTAEGAIGLALAEMEVTLHGSMAVVLGFGRTAQPLAQRLRALGAETVVAARSQADLARAFAAGHAVSPLNKLTAILPAVDLVCNTIPAMVMTETELACCGKDTFVLDLASAPGGVDLRAAQRLGLKATQAPGLPGRVAPVTAGRYVADLIAHDLSSRGLWPAAKRRGE